MDILYIVIAAIIGMVAGYHIGLHDKDWNFGKNNGNSGTRD